jgi:hypothetical protein
MIFTVAIFGVVAGIACTTSNKEVKLTSIFDGNTLTGNTLPNET